MEIQAWDNTTDRIEEAHEYCQKFLPGASLGENVWHCILDDALKLRKEKEAHDDTPRTS